MAGATTLLNSSMSEKTHSSRCEVIRKSPLNNACKPYRKYSILVDAVFIEAVPRALLPSKLRAKHRDTNMDFLSLSTGWKKAITQCNCMIT